jgi:hypothetical protein
MLGVRDGCKANIFINYEDEAVDARSINGNDAVPLTVDVTVVVPDMSGDDDAIAVDGKPAIDLRAAAGDVNDVAFDVSLIE